MEPAPRQLPTEQVPEQAAASEGWPATPPKVPTGHSEQAVAPEVEVYDPAGQGAQMAPRP